MKICMLVLVMAALLAGCGTEETFETVADVLVQPAAVMKRETSVQLPQGAALSVMVSDAGDRIYLCDGYTVTVQTLDSGDLDRSLRSVSGFGRDELTVIETKQELYPRYDFTWVSAGEGGDQVGRGCLIDDGDYHYVLSIMASAAESGGLSQVWEEIFASFLVA